MSGTELERLVVQLEANTERLRREFKKGENRADSFQQRMKRMVKNIRRGMKNLGKSVGNVTAKLTKGFAVGATAAAAGVTLLYKRSAAAIDRIGKLSTRLGISTEAMGTLRHVAQQSGMEFQQLATAVQRMSRRIADARGASNEYAKAIKALGLDQQKLIAMAPENQFIKVREALDQVENASIRASLAQKLFDSEGVGVLQIKNLRDLTDEARAFGLAMSEEAVRGVEASNDAMGRLKSLLTGVSDNLTAAFAPALQELADFITGKLQDSIKENGGSVRAWALGISADVLTAIRNISLKVQEMAARVPAIRSMLGLDDIESQNIDKLRAIERALQARVNQASENQAYWLDAATSGWGVAENQAANWTNTVEDLSERLQAVRGQIAGLNEEGGEGFIASLDRMIEKTQEARQVAMSGGAPLASAGGGESDGNGGGSGAPDQKVVDYIAKLTRELELLEAKTGPDKVFAQLGMTEAAAGAEEIFNLVTAIQALRTANEAAANEQSAALDIKERHKTLDERILTLQGEMANLLPAMTELTGSEVEAQNLLNLEYERQLELMRERKGLHEEEKGVLGELFDYKVGIFTKEGELDKKGMAAKIKNAAAGNKKLGAIFKAHAIAQTIVATASGIQKAFADLGFPAGIPAAAMVAATGAINLATIKGQFHSGIDSVPSSGTYLLDKGERVVDSRLNADLKQYLAGAGATNNNQSANISMSFGSDPDPDAVANNRGQIESTIRNIFSEHALDAPF